MKTEMIQSDDLENLLDVTDITTLSGPNDDDEGNDLIFEGDDDFELDDLDSLGDFDDFDDDDF